MKEIEEVFIQKGLNVSNLFWSLEQRVLICETLLKEDFFMSKNKRPRKNMSFNDTISLLQLILTVISVTVVVLTLIVNIIVAIVK